MRRPPPQCGTEQPAKTTFFAGGKGQMSEKAPRAIFSNGTEQPAKITFFAGGKGQMSEKAPQATFSNLTGYPNGQ